VSVLTELQQQLWWDLADVIGSGSTGKTLFAKVNQPRYYVTNTGRAYDAKTEVPFTDPLDPVVDPPATLSVVMAGVGTPTIDDSANTLTIPELAAGASSFLAGAGGDTPAVQYVFVSAGQSPSRFSRAHPYQLVSALVYTSESLGDANAQTIDLAALGLPTIAGYVMYVKRYVQAADGRISTPIEERITIVA